jgi:hypothetical protein
MNDRCVICYRETEYDVDTHVDERINYVDGVGQVCTECSQNGNIFSRKSICIPERMIESTPNDWELGEKVRNLYRSNLYT